MYRVMIVDDELIIRKGLINLTPWAALDCEVVCESPNGIDAISKLKDFKPDIIITDIKMPGLNGIELSKHVYDNYPSTKVIILTGFADFSYAQSAIKYSVVDFVLKPTSNEKIIEAINRAKEIIIRQKEKEMEIEALEGKVVKNRSELIERFFLGIINGSLIDLKEIDRESNELGTQLSNYCALLFEADSTGTVENSMSAEKYGGFLSPFKNMLSLAFKDMRHFIFPVSRQRVCVILDFNAMGFSDCIQSVLQISEEVLQTINSFMDFTISVGISAMHRSCHEVSSAYDEASKALFYKFYNESKISIYTPDIPGTADSCDLFSFKFIEALMDEIRTGNHEKAVSALNNFFIEQKDIRMPIDYVKNICIQICSLCSKLLLSYGSSLKDITGDCDSLYRDIFQCKSIKSLSDTISSVVKIVSVYAGNSNKRVSSIIRKSLEFINQNFNKNINLQTVADFIHVNSSYLSRIFKKETGENITDAINRIKMEKAKEFLSDPDAKSYEVAYRVGIEDPSYFSVLFKKYTGMNPTEYRFIKGNSDRKVY